MLVLGTLVTLLVVASAGLEVDMFGLLGSGATANAAQHAGDYANSGGGQSNYSGVVGWLQDLLKLDDQEMRDFLEGSAEQGLGQMGKSTQGINHHQFKQGIAPGQDAIHGLMATMKLSAPGERGRLAVPDIHGLLGMGGPYG